MSTNFFFTFKLQILMKFHKRRKRVNYFVIHYLLTNLFIILKLRYENVIKDKP